MWRLYLGQNITCVWSFSRIFFSVQHEIFKYLRSGWYLICNQFLFRGWLDILCTTSTRPSESVCDKATSCKEVALKKVVVGGEGFGKKNSWHLPIKYIICSTVFSTILRIHKYYSYSFRSLTSIFVSSTSLKSM